MRIFDTQQSKIQNKTALARPLAGLAGRWAQAKKNRN